MGERTVPCRLLAMVAAVAAACVIAFGFGVGEAHAQDSELAAAAMNQVSEQASASSSCALLRKDGNLWRCTSKGKPVSKYWDGKKKLSSQLNKVKTIFVSSDVASVSPNAYTWIRYRYSSGTTSDYRNTTSLTGIYFKNVKTVKFLTNSSGVNKCKVIADRAFSGAPKIAKIANFNKTKVSRIGQWAFSRTKIASLAFPKTLKKIDKYAFYSCSKFKSASGLKKTKLKTLGANAFSSCKKLKTIALPGTCKTIANSAFYDCVSLKSASLGSKTAEVGDHAFSNCEKLASISLPATCTKLGYSAFSGCSSLKKVLMRSKSVVVNASSSTSYMSSQFYGTPIEVAGNSAYIYVPKSVLSKYKSSSYTNRWYDLRTKFKAI